MKECINKVITFVIIIVISFIVGYILGSNKPIESNQIKKRDTIELYELEDIKEYSLHSELTI